MSDVALRSMTSMHSLNAMTSFLAVANQKGGVAKTTNTINTAGALAERGYEVLVIDADPQGYLSRLLGLTNAYNTDDTNLATAFKEPNQHNLSGLVHEHAEFNVVSSSIEMFMLQQELIASGWKPRERLSMLFNNMDAAAYDFVVVDAPPSLGVINDNVLLACRRMLLPVEADGTSVHALDILLNQIETLEERYSAQITQAAVIISNVNYPLDNKQKEMIEYFEETFKGRCPVHQIRHRAAIKRSLDAEGSIFGENAEETDMTKNYLALADDLGQLVEVAADV